MGLMGPTGTLLLVLVLTGGVDVTGVDVTGVDVTSPGSCVVEHCAKQLFECEVDKIGRRWNSCTMKCQMDDLACQMRCADLYKPTDDPASKINEFSECVITDNHCVAQSKQTCPLPARTQQNFNMSWLSGQ